MNTSEKEMTVNTSEKEMTVNTPEKEMTVNTSEKEMTVNTPEKEMTVKTEQAWVCDWCHLVVANGETDPDRTPGPMSLLPGWWYSAGHRPDDECIDCNPDIGWWCDICDRESSPAWVCDGCGDQPGMFFDMYLIEKETAQ